MERKNPFRSRPNHKTHETLLDLCHAGSSEAKERESILPDPFCKFFYRDHITRHRYEIENLKFPKKRYKTEISETARSNGKSLNFFNDGLKMLQNINDNRKKDLIEEFK